MNAGFRVCGLVPSDVLNAHIGRLVIPTMVAILSFCLPMKVCFVFVNGQMWVWIGFSACNLCCLSSWQGLACNCGTDPSYGPDESDCSVLDFFDAFYLFWLCYPWVAVCLVLLSSIRECNTYKCSGLIKYAQSCGELASVVMNPARFYFLGVLVVAVGERVYGLTSTLRALAKRAVLRIINMGVSLSSNAGL